MWFRRYRDYPIDRPVIKYQVQPGEGIVGCEMHEIFGWGVTLDRRTTEHRVPEKKER